MILYKDTSIVNITVNGEKRQFDSPLTISGLLEALGLKEQMVLVEHNRNVVPKDEMPQMAVADGDVIEVFRLAGGG